MKNKPIRHKETNTFKFKPFLEKVNEIDFDVFHKITHVNEVVSSETETFFYQCLQKWNFLNLSQNYSNFRKEVVDIITLPQLLNKKQHVIDTLLKYLKLKDPLCLQSIFELIIAVVKDLQLDFYVYFPEFLASIIDLLHTKNAEQLEHTFTTLAYLFKFQWRYMIKNVDKIFDILLPLLADTHPVYINDFAAESFAFVVRKVRKKEEFLELVLQTLEKKQNGIIGCGKLLFHVISGTSGHFHSCTEFILTLYLNALMNSSVNHELLFQVLSIVFDRIVHEIHPKKCDIFWTIIFKAIDDFTENSLFYLLRLIQLVINYKGGQMLQDSSIWSKKLLGMVDKYYRNKILLEEIANTIAVTLLASNVKLLQETSSFLIIKMLSIVDRDLLLRITEKLITYTSFETLVLPLILKKSMFSDIDEKLLELMTKIIKVKSAPVLSGINFDKWIKFNLDIYSKNNAIFLSNHLDSLKEGEIKENALKVLIILPHLSIIKEQLYAKIIENFILLFKRVLKINDYQNKINFAFLLYMESVVRIMKPNDFHCMIKEHFSLNSDLLSAFILQENNIAILNALDISLTYLKNSYHVEEYINQSSFDKLHQSLAVQLGSSNSTIRLTTCHLYSLFSFISSPNLNTQNVDSKNALELLYLIEKEPVTLHQYRDRLLYLHALNFQGTSVSQLNINYRNAPLQYLFGNLYLNFSLLWDPVCETITSYATDECPHFWPIFLSKLKYQNNVETIFNRPIFKCNTLSNLVDYLFPICDKVDNENYTLLLWKCMSRFVPYCEVKNRDYVSIFIDFVENNIFRSNSEDAMNYDIKKHEQTVHFKNITDLKAIEINNKEEIYGEGEQKEEEQDIDNNDSDFNADGKDHGEDTNYNEIKSKKEKNKENKNENKQKESKDQLTKSKHVKLLLTMLQVFGKFTNTRSLYREPEIQKIFFDLLSSKNSEIQKAALSCIYTYKYKYIMPYKVHLDNIVDEKNLKNELARFQISAGEDIETNIQEEHRQNLMPIIMRILLAKMSQKVGIRTGGKAGGLVKRKIILRFLAGVKEEEMMMFVKMAFKPFKNYLPVLNINQENDSKINLEEMVNNILDNVKLEYVIPPKRLQSILNLLSVIIEQFGGKMMEKLLPHLLAILICVLAQITGILNKSAEVHSNYLMPIRNARNHSINILARFFTHFEKYDWSIYEINALFKVAVFPWLNNLPIEGIHSPTPLLKMMMAWSKNPRYYPLFIKLNKDEKTPLFFLVKLLLFEKTHKSVLQTLLDMFEKMLTLQNIEKEEIDAMDIDEQKLKSMIPIVFNKIDIVENDSINYGSIILFPYITDILTYFERNLKNQSKNIVNKTELVILSRISEFVSDPITCNTLLILILPILQKKSTDSEETVIQLLTTVTNLMKHVEQPKIHLRSIQYLLSQIISIPARKMLMELLNIVVKNNETMKRNQEILTDLNAYDQRWIEQPDFKKRLDAFEEIDNLIKKNQVTLEWGVAVIHNCFFFLKTENDLAMKDRSGYCLKSMGVFLAKNLVDSSADKKYLLDETILTMVRIGIRSKNENLKLQSIAFIGHMAMECPEVHPVLRDLNILTNKQDVEVDFFENMQHLQLYRRAKALHKFCKIAKNMIKTPNSKTLTQFILPLASSYLCNEQFIHKNSLIDAAIETVGVTCRLLPWNQYEIVLRFYLDKLRSCTDFQRQLIRITVAIIDSFHFDLSKYKEFDEESSKNLKIKDFIVSVDKVEQSLQTKSFQKSTVSEILKPTTKNVETKNISESKDINEISIENMDDALNSNIDDIVEDSEQETTKDIPAVEKQTVLSQFMTKRLVYNISKGLLPQLHNAIAVRTRHEGSHKVNKKRIETEQEEEELMRVPIALAMVKLLQKLPHGILDAHLHGIFMKLCTFLKSRLESVRRTTREILKNIMITLGPNYLHYLLKEMNSLLIRGFHVHVLVYTIHAVLVSLKPMFKPEHITSNLSSIITVCKIDLFGPSSEEKEIANIVRNTSEAKSTKSFDIFHILGEFINEGSMIDVVIPLKDVLFRTHSHKTVRKIIEALRQLCLGLADNKYVQIQQLLTFLYGITSESIPQLTTKNKTDKEDNKKKLDSIKKKVDCFLIPTAPKTKMGIKTSAKTSKNTNAHVIIEFGLKLFHILLKRDKVTNPELKPILDSFVPILSDCLKSQHIKLSALALQCLNWILKMDLPLIRSLIFEISSSIFNILHKYAVAGLSKGENFDLVMAAFKSMSVIVRDVKYFNITSDQLKILLIYAEQDLHDSDKQATAFGLLKAIIHRKLLIDEIHQVMENVAKLSIISELDIVRKQARTVFYSYLVNYPLGKNLEKYMSFYVTQLGYELQPGRLSALEMIYGIVTSFPLEILIEYAGLLFLTLGARLVNDDDSICKKVCAKCIKEIIYRVPHNQKNKLFETIILWLKDKKVVHRRLAVQLCGLFVIVEKDEFEFRLKQVLPLLVKLFYNNENFDDNDCSGRFDKIQKEQNNDIQNQNIKDLVRLKDHLLFQLLQLLLKICTNCSIFFKNKTYQEYIDIFAEYSQSLLAHPHLWVRLASSQLLGFILAALDVNKVINLINNTADYDPDDGYMYSDPIEQLRSLILDSTAQLQPDTEFEELYDQIIKNLIFIAKFLKISNIDESSSKIDDKNNKNDISLLWLLKKLRKCINIEISQSPKSTIVRSSVFKWMAGVISTLDINALKPILFHFMSALVREMSTTEESNAPLRQLAKEIATMIKKKINIEDYTRLLSQTQQKLDIRRSERKKIRSQQLVIDPELAAKRKIAKQQKKKILRKRKIEHLSGKKGIRKKTKKEIEIEIT